MHIIFASWNPKKTEEIQRMAPNGVIINCLKDIPEAVDVPQAEENGGTFLENAKIKARYWAQKLNQPVLAEDSGIEIECLNGYPGVYTKRCIQELNPHANVDVDNPAELYPELLRLMQYSGSKNTRAHWVSAMVCIIPKEVENRDTEICAIEELNGDMCECAGERVFGFDQYFKPAGYNKTLSEMLPEEKDKIGPRKKAFEQIMKELQKK